MALTIFSIMILFLTAVETAIPYLIKRTVVFGVSIPEAHVKEDKLLQFKRNYSRIVLGCSLLIFGGFLWTAVGATEEKTVMLGTTASFAIIIISLSSYFYFHAKTMQLKKAEKWGENLKQVKITDLSVRSQDEMLPWSMYLLPIVITLGVIGYTIIQYDLLPSQIPTHWGLNGQPDAFTEKNPITAIMAPLILLIMQVMFLGINEMTKRSGIKLSVQSTEYSKVRQLTLRKYSSWFMFFTSLVTTMLFCFLQLSTIHSGLFGEGMMLVVPFAFLLVILLATIGFAVKAGRAGEGIAVGTVNGIGDVDEDQFWRVGIFYYNRNDPSIFVEKRFGVGWTINFANPKGYLIIFGPLLLILILTYFL